MAIGHEKNVSISKASVKWNKNFTGIHSHPSQNDTKKRNNWHARYAQGCNRGMNVTWVKNLLSDPQTQRLNFKEDWSGGVVVVHVSPWEGETERIVGGLVVGKRECKQKGSSAGGGG